MTTPNDADAGSAPDAPLSLADPADEYTREDWEKATAAVLRKARRLTDEDADAQVWESLTRTTLDGVRVPPIGTQEDAAGLADAGAPGAAPFTRGRLPERPESGWDIRAHLGGLDAKESSEAALLDLENGVTSLWIELGGPLAADGLGAALNGVLLDLAPVIVEDAADPVTAARALAEVLVSAGVTPAEGTNLGADPIGAMVRGIASSGTMSDTVSQVAELARDAGTLALVVDGTAVHDLGASDAQELGYTLATGVAYLRTLTTAGWSVDDALGLIEFRLAATDEQFPTIAKFRAARRLWARVAQLSGASPEAGGQRQHAVTSRPMMSAYDPWVNMLRTTVAAFAAGVGGADSVTVLPFDSPLGLPDSLGRRNARNTSSLLIHESHVAKVTDPAGGSYAVERLTDSLATAAWEQFQLIERDGGIEDAWADGSLRERIEEVAATRADLVAHRTQPLTGITEFPNLAETKLARATDPLAKPVARYGAAFEALRDSPAESPVFLATLGPVAAHTARATFAANLLAAGGIRAVTAGPTDAPESLVERYRAEKSPAVAMLCGSDTAYADWGAAAITALREAGATTVLLAGKPGERTVPADAIDGSAAMGVDALSFITTTREKL